MEHYLKGLKHYGEGRWEDAVGEFDLGLALQPDWADCLQAKGMAQMNAGKNADALATLRRVTELAPEDPSAFTSLSMAYQRNGNIQEAEDAQMQARMLEWKREVAENPHAPPPPPGPGPGPGADPSAGA